MCVLSLCLCSLCLVLSRSLPLSSASYLSDYYSLSPFCVEEAEGPRKEAVRAAIMQVVRKAVEAKDEIEASEAQVSKTLHIICRERERERERRARWSERERERERERDWRCALLFLSVLYSPSIHLFVSLTVGFAGCRHYGRAVRCVVLHSRCVVIP